MSEEEPGGLKFLFKMNRLQDAYQDMTETDEDGNVVPLKMQASKEFKEKFNEFVHRLLVDCVNSARGEGRKMLQPKDVPELEDVPPEEPT